MNKHITIDATNRATKSFIKPMVIDSGKVAQLTNGLPKEILDETGGFYCIESTRTLRARD